VTIHAREGDGRSGAGTREASAARSAPFGARRGVAPGRPGAGTPKT
jgi:hypothetical protein